jgi:CBS domain-containing membrane protein
MKDRPKNMDMDSCPVDISDDDVLAAMKTIPGYLDITPGDFKEIYSAAYTLAVERLTRSVTAKDVMTEKVVTVKADVPLKEVAQTMGRHNITGVPVIDDAEAVVGIITEADFLSHLGDKKTQTFMEMIATCLQGSGCIALSMRKQTAADIMASPPITIREDTTVFQIADTFVKNNINRVPVLDHNNHLAGIVTRTDLVTSACRTA